MKYDIVILGLSITSNWGHGHAAAYRGLVTGLAQRGHRVLFLERDQPAFAENRDDPQPEGAVTRIYQTPADLHDAHVHDVADAELVIVGSSIPDGVQVGEWVLAHAGGRTAFYDLDTPVTLEKLTEREEDYLAPELVPEYDCYLSTTGGPTLRRIEEEFGSPMARPLYCCADPRRYEPEAAPIIWEMGFLGAFAPDRQAGIEELLMEPARNCEDRRFAVAGPGYPDAGEWPSNVDYRTYLSFTEHPHFYARQRFALNVTRSPMKTAGYSPSVRLFEAAACATPVISDWWPGLDRFFRPDREILVAEDGASVLEYLRNLPEAHREEIAARARNRLLNEHTPLHRAQQVESYMREMTASPARRSLALSHQR